MPRVIPAGVRGFDCNTPVSLAYARAFVKEGYRFALRYLPRVTAHRNDLTADERKTLHLAGLALMPVQHVESESSWEPTVEKGRQYGQVAADYAKAVGVAPGTTVWLDLEGVAVGTPPETVIQYCNYWHDRVKLAGYLPGIYVGWHSLLTPAQLYQRLKFTRYWAAYNLNADQYPLVRGICLRQHAVKTGELPPGIPFEVDTDTARPDLRGDSATCDAPEEWDVPL